MSESQQKTNENQLGFTPTTVTYASNSDDEIYEISRESLMEEVNQWKHNYLDEKLAKGNQMAINEEQSKKISLLNDELNEYKIITANYRNMIIVAFNDKQRVLEEMDKLKQHHLEKYESHVKEIDELKKEKQLLLDQLKQVKIDSRLKRKKEFN